MTLSKGPKRLLSGFLVLVMSFTILEQFAFGFDPRLVKLGEGATISHVASYYQKEYGISVNQLTQDILDFNGISREQARRLPVGKVIKLPPTKAEYEQEQREVENKKNQKIAEIRDDLQRQKKNIIQRKQRELAANTEQIKRENLAIINSAKEKKEREIEQSIKQKELQIMAQKREEADQIINEIRKEKQNLLKLINDAASQKENIDKLIRESNKLKAEIAETESKTGAIKKRLELMIAVANHLHNKIAAIDKNWEIEIPENYEGNDPQILSEKLAELEEHVEALAIEYEVRREDSQAKCKKQENKTYYEDSNDVPENESSEFTTIEDLEKFDSENTKYAEYARIILSNIEAPSYNYVDSQGRDLENISRKISNVCRQVKQISGKSAHPVQVMTVLRLADNILNGRGAIAQVKTGEGKSLIIAILSIVLAQFGHKIDVVTSTEELAKRDQENQKKYYDHFNINSGVLIHNVADKDTMEAKVSESSSFNLESLDSNIVYSTNSNFEFVFLFSIFRKKPLRTRPYDVVIVDETDNMLLDQGMSPAIISNSLPVKDAEKIFRTVYELREKDIDQIIDELRKRGLNEDIPEYTVQMLLNAAQAADEHIKDKHYTVQDDRVLIIDESTGCVKPGSRWNNFIHEMVEVKENVPMKETSVSNCLITQKAFFNMYSRITGLTGTVGSEDDKNLLIKSYNVKVFYMPRHFPSKQIVTNRSRPFSIAELFEQLSEEINEKHAEGVPVLVIMPWKILAEDFCVKKFPQAKMILGVDAEQDKQAIKEAGEVGAITIATNAAGRGIDIDVRPASLDRGGLYVIIPFMPQNDRILEQAMGRSARQGQPGWASLYTLPFDRFLSTSDFNPNYEKLMELQGRFANYIREKWPWMYEYELKYKILESEYPLGVTSSGVLKSATRELACKIPMLGFWEDQRKVENILSNGILSMVLTSWGVFFTSMSEQINDFGDPQDLEAEYQDFLLELTNWLPEDCNTFGKMVSHISSSTQIAILDELAEKVLQAISAVFDMVLPDQIKEFLENRAVQGVLKTTTGVAQIVAGCELCVTVVGALEGVPMIVMGANMAIVGIQDLWHVIRGDDEESKNLLKEITGHKADHLVDLTELVVTAKSGKAIKNSERLGEATAKLKETFNKAKRTTAAISEEVIAAGKAVRQVARKQLAKFRGSKRTVKAIDIDKYITKKVKARKAPKVPENPSSTFRQMTDAELAEVRGGTIDPNWIPGEGDSQSINFDSINKTSYNPRAMEEMFQKEGQEISSSTLPRSSAKNVKLAGCRHPETGIVFDKRGLPIFDDIAKCDLKLPADKAKIPNRNVHFKQATKSLKQLIENESIDKNQFTKEQLCAIFSEEKKIPGYTWHHHQDVGRMQLVPEAIHAKTGHMGGFDLWFK